MDVVQAAISATTIVEIRKVKASLLQLHGLKVHKDDVDQFLDDVSFINFETDTYHPQVGTELVAFFSKLATYCADAEINLEVIRQFQFSLEKFDSNWSQQEAQLVGNTLYAMTRTFTKHSKVYQSAVALLKDMARNKALQSKKLHSIPLELLKDIQQVKSKRMRSAKDDVDFPAKAPRQSPQHGSSTVATGDPSTATEEGEEEEEEEDIIAAEEVGRDYIDYMVELAEAGEEKIKQLESQILDMGYEPNII